MTTAGPERCNDLDCYVDHSMNLLSIIYSDIEFWGAARVVLQIAAVVFGVIGTVMMALPNNENKIIKTVGIIATTLVTGIASGTSSLRIPERVQNLTRLYDEGMTITNDFKHDVNGKSGDELDARVIRFVGDFKSVKMRYLQIKILADPEPIRKALLQ